MAKIKIKDLPKDYKISEDEMKRIKGGLITLLQTEITDSISGGTSDSEYNLIKNKKI